MKKTIELSGIIKKGWSGSWEVIKLVQDDGYKIDLIGRFKEASESFEGSRVQVNYFLSDAPCTKNDMVEGWLKKISGAIYASFEANGYSYSSWTSGTDYDTTFKVGGHDMLSELRNEEGRFLIIQMNFKL